MYKRGVTTRKHLYIAVSRVHATAVSGARPTTAVAAWHFSDETAEKIQAAALERRRDHRRPRRRGLRRSHITLPPSPLGCLPVRRRQHPLATPCCSGRPALAPPPAWLLRPPHPRYAPGRPCSRFRHPLDCHSCFCCCCCCRCRRPTEGGRPPGAPAPLLSRFLLRRPSRPEMVTTGPHRTGHGPFAFVAAAAAAAAAGVAAATEGLRHRPNRPPPPPRGTQAGVGLGKVSVGAAGRAGPRRRRHHRRRR